MYGKLTKEQAIEMAQSGWWIGMEPRDVAIFQLIREPLCCMPLSVLMECLSQALGRPTYHHELAFDIDGIRRELLGDRPAPTRDEIIALIPQSKRILF